MKILTDSNYDGGDITHVDIMLQSEHIGRCLIVDAAKPTISTGYLKRPCKLTLLFNDCDDFDNFIDTLLEFKRHYKYKPNKRLDNGELWDE